MRTPDSTTRYVESHLLPFAKCEAGIRSMKLVPYLCPSFEQLWYSYATFRNSQRFIFFYMGYEIGTIGWSVPTKTHHKWPDLLMSQSEEGGAMVWGRPTSFIFSSKEWSFMHVIFPISKCSAIYSAKGRVHKISLYALLILYHGKNIIHFGEVFWIGLI